MPPMHRARLLCAAALASCLAGLVGTRNARRLLVRAEAALHPALWAWSLHGRTASEWLYWRGLAVPALAVLLATELTREV